MLPTPRRISTNQRLARARMLRGRVGLGLVAVLSVLSGMTDAIGFLETGDFVSFMSGNTTRLAVAVSDHDGSTVLRLAGAVMAFIAGNLLGVVVSHTTGRRTLPVMLFVSALLCTAALSPLAAQPFSLFATIVAMGALNAAVEQVNGLPIGLTYVTGALSRFGRGLGRWLMGERVGGWRVQLIPWAGMFAGAIVGAILHRHLAVDALWASAVVAFLLGVAALKIPRQWQLNYMPR